MSGELELYDDKIPWDWVIDMTPDDIELRIPQEAWISVNEDNLHKFKSWEFRKEPPRGARSTHGYLPDFYIEDPYIYVKLWFHYPENRAYQQYIEQKFSKI